ncbi:hypothetical protein FJTKL_08322 [Diaporthe vaccinii]|uniref:Transcription factor domain-containing protein n=1 Tax=Diaporthe vaccinii TaxID=105482 RepID=A0ABR4DP57_9PEZI
MPSTDDILQPHEWHPDSAIDYRSETRWSALCASIKEDIMELLFDRGRTHRSSKVSELQKVAEQQWSALPEHFRIVDGKSDRMRTPFDRDFLISLRLNHLHVKFLLRRLLLDRLPQPDGPLIEIAQQILALVVEAILTRDEPANSGTTLSWKVAYYGLPATGMILLAMTAQPMIPCLKTARAKVLRDLAVLAAEVEQGTIVKPEDPNYAVLAQAAQTIRRFLDLIHNEDQRIRTSREVSLSNNAEDDYMWAASLGSEIWDSEISFWPSLAEHPSPFAQYSVAPH